jgi:hypothetical protein
VLLLLHPKRPDRLPVQPDLRHLQVRNHEGRLQHHLHQRRQGVLRDLAIVLRDTAVLPRTRLLLLRLLQQHAVLLRHLLNRVAVSRTNILKESLANPVRDSFSVE